MMATIETVLAEQTAALLEQAAFVFSTPADEPVSFTESVLCAGISFGGGRRGALEIAVHQRCAEGLAAELLGMDPGDPDANEKAGDALGELLNMLTGMVSDNWTDLTQPLDIGTPAVRTESMNAAASADSDDVTTVYLLTEEGEPIRVSLRLEG